MKEIIEKIKADNPVYRLISQQEMKAGTIWFYLPWFLIFFGTFIFVSFFYACSNFGEIKWALIPFRDVCLIATNVMIMLGCFTILISHHNILANAKKQLAYDQMMMTGLSPLTWLTGATSALLRSYRLFLTFMIPVFCFLWLFNIVPLVLIPTMVLAYTCFFLNGILLLLLLERGVFNFYAGSLFLGNFLMLLFPVFMPIMSAKVVHFLHDELLWFPVLNPAIFSLEYFHFDCHAIGLVNGEIAHLNQLSLWGYFLPCQILLFAISLAYLLVGKDYREISQDKFPTLIYVSNKQAMLYDQKENKANRIRQEDNNDLRKFQENHSTYFLKNSAWIRPIIDLVVFILIVAIFFQLFHSPYKDKHFYAAYLLLFPVIPVLSLGLKIITAFPDKNQPLSKHLNTIAVNLIYPIGKIIILVFVFHFISKQLQATDRASYKLLSPLYPEIMVYTILVLVSAALFTTIHLKKSFNWFVFLVALWILLLPGLLFVYSEFVNQFDFLKACAAISPLLTILHFCLDKKPDLEMFYMFTTYCQVIFIFFILLTIILGLMKKMKKATIGTLSLIFFSLLFLGMRSLSGTATPEKPSEAYFRHSAILLENLRTPSDWDLIWPGQGFGYIVFAAMLFLGLFLYFMILLIKQTKKKKVNLKTLVAPIVILFFFSLGYKVILNRQPEWKEIDIRARMQLSKQTKRWRYWQTLVTTTGKMELPDSASGLYSFNRTKLTTDWPEKINPELLTYQDFGKLERTQDYLLKDLSCKAAIPPSKDKVTLSFSEKIPSHYKHCAIYISDPEAQYSSAKNRYATFTPEQANHTGKLELELNYASPIWMCINTLQHTLTGADTSLILIAELDPWKKKLKADIIPAKAIFQEPRAGTIFLDQTIKFSATAKKKTDFEFNLKNDYLEKKQVENQRILLNITYNWDLPNNYQHKSTAIVEIKQQGDEKWQKAGTLTYKPIAELTDKEVRIELQDYQNFGEVTPQKRFDLPGDNKVIDSKKPILQVRFKKQGKGPDINIESISTTMHYWVKNYD